MGEVAGGSRWRRPTQALLVALAALVFGCGDYVPLENTRSTRYEDRGTDLVFRYCSYAASSVPDLEGCLRRVTPKQVRNDDANAGRYAIGESVRCRADAGPYCGKIGPYVE